MEYVYINGTDLKCSRIGLGTWAIGGWLWGGSDEKQSINTILSSFEKGINLIDTAPVYGFGVSEEMVGKAVSGYGSRDKVIISTKVGLNWKDGKVFRDSSHKRIYEETCLSLKRLKTDYIDIYQVHWPDCTTPFQETAEALMKLYQKGIIRAIGVSNYTPSQMDQFRQVSTIHINQPPYNLFEKEIDIDIFPYCNENGITMLLYGALCRGLLSGRMKSDTKFKGDDIRKFDPKFAENRYGQYLHAVEELDIYANANFKKNVIQLSIRWVLDKASSHISLWGARSPEQLDPIDEIFNWKLSDLEIKEIESIVKNIVTDGVGPEFMAPP